MLSFYFIKIANATCADGYFDNSGTWTKWQSSWLTWTNSTAWASWSNRFLNSTTMLCELCPDGQFYSDSLLKWLDWSGSWSGQCAYQVSCFDCSKYASQGLTKFSLTKMKCVSDWASTEVYIQDPQLRNFSIWRGLTYYVDPEGTEIIELGTLKYPYK